MTTNAAAAGQISKSAAEIYDEFFVPALFGVWAAPLCDAADIRPGHSVLDVACGSGATTRIAAERVSPGGAVTGLDCNEGMLDVARSRMPLITWTHGQAEALPFEDNMFDAVLCQFGLMFFDDRQQALSEMLRVLRPGGRMAVSVWDKAENSPGYAAMIDLIDRLFGNQAADALRAPFILGEPEKFHSLFEGVGMGEAIFATQMQSARFASIEDWVRMDVRGWTLSDMIDEAGYAKLLAEAKEVLKEFAGPDGAVEFPAPAHIAVCQTRN
ncbi:MAG: methyltransferase domain-containing protein [Stappiaceae bacterium]